MQSQYFLLRICAKEAVQSARHLEFVAWEPQRWQLAANLPPERAARSVLMSREQLVQAFVRGAEWAFVEFRSRYLPLREHLLTAFDDRVPSIGGITGACYFDIAKSYIEGLLHDIDLLMRYVASSDDGEPRIPTDSDLLRSVRPIIWSDEEEQELLSGLEKEASLAERLNQAPPPPFGFNTPKKLAEFAGIADKLEYRAFERRLARWREAHPDHHGWKEVVSNGGADAKYLYQHDAVAHLFT